MEWCAHPIMGPDYLAATDRFPFLAAKDRQHTDWLRFFTASRAKAAALWAADGGTAVQVPQTPPGLPPVQQMPPVQQLPPSLPDPADSIDLIKEVPGAFRAPSKGWTVAAMYARYSKPLKPGLPPLREIMVQQVGFSVY